MRFGVRRLWMFNHDVEEVDSASDRGIRTDLVTGRRLGTYHSKLNIAFPAVHKLSHRLQRIADRVHHRFIDEIIVIVDRPSGLFRRGEIFFI